MIATPDAARETWPCPLALTFAARSTPNCRGETCPVWRWVPLSSEHPAFVSAVKARQKEIGGNALAAHKAAVAWVMDRREELGIPTRPTHGFCGLGGRVEA